MCFWKSCTFASRRALALMVTLFRASLLFQPISEFQIIQSDVNKAQFFEESFSSVSCSVYVIGFQTDLDHACFLTINMNSCSRWRIYLKFSYCGVKPLRWTRKHQNTCRLRNFETGCITVFGIGVWLIISRWFTFHARYLVMVYWFILGHSNGCVHVIAQSICLLNSIVGARLVSKTCRHKSATTTWTKACSFCFGGNLAVIYPSFFIPYIHRKLRAQWHDSTVVYFNKLSVEQDFYWQREITLDLPTVHVFKYNVQCITIM